MTVIVLICAIYVLLGTAMEELSMILLTVPVLFPLVVHLGFDPLWFGILVVVVVEIGLISPPVGMNMFVLRTLLPQRLDRHASIAACCRSSSPTSSGSAILISLPMLSTWLPTCCSADGPVPVWRQTRQTPDPLPGDARTAATGRVLISARCRSSLPAARCR